MESDQQLASNNSALALSPEGVGLTLQVDYNQSIKGNLSGKLRRMAGVLALALTANAIPADANIYSPTDSTIPNPGEVTKLYDQLVTQGFPEDRLLPENELEKLNVAFIKATGGANTLSRTPLLAINGMCLPPISVYKYKISSTIKPLVNVINPFKENIDVVSSALFENGKRVVLPGQELTILELSKRQGVSNKPQLKPSSMLDVDFLPAYVAAGYTDANQTPPSKVTVEFSDPKTSKLLARSEIVVPPLRYDRTNPNPKGICSTPTEENKSSNFVVEPMDPASIEVWKKMYSKVTDGVAMDSQAIAVLYKAATKKLLAKSSAASAVAKLKNTK